MPVILKLDTKPSLFEPLEIEVDGHKLRVKEIGLRGLEKIQEMQADLNSGSCAAIMGTLKTLVEGSNKALEAIKDLPLSKLRELLRVLMERSIRPTEEEKNGPGLGDASSPS